ncbi:MAG: glycosyltransferase [Chloroflexaceae bacterium]|nr:glycosyltransferase [Chloroflexaceae bacterium]
MSAHVANPDLVTLSHLRWDFVYQRPQHIMARMATDRRVFFIEEPLFEAGVQPYWELLHPQPNVTVARLRTPLEAPGFHSSHMPTLVPLLHQLLAAQQVQSYTSWVYTPLALPIVQSLASKLIVYDCMDELSAFLHAPPELLAQEATLLQWADLVFTGGPSLYRAKRHRHPHTYCFPSSVETHHFRQARTSPQAHDIAHLPQPRLGFYGVIDERMDLGLLDAMATAHPEWQIVMVGPVVKICPKHLPEHPNIHYLGQRSYAELPSYLAGWDVCLLPFARNEATRFISPTKTLEYMAAERPIVSTPITDVAEPYGNIVYLGDTRQAFVAACEQALAASADERESRVAMMQAVLAQTSWDSTVQTMKNLISQAMQTGTPRRAARATRVPDRVAAVSGV